MQRMVSQAFHDWTKDLSEDESRIKIFEKIRDIPFIIAPELFDFKKAQVEMLEKNQGICISKHLLLGAMYKELSIPTRYSIYPFRWSDLGVAYPQDLRELAKDLPITYHFALQALISGKWVLVDATWDSALKRAGFPVNEEWDGKSNTKIAVTPQEEFNYEDALKGSLFLKQKFAFYQLAEKKKLKGFSHEINKWLEGIRTTTPR